MRKIKNIHPAAAHPIHDLSTYRPLPNRSLPNLDPFLFLNHHGYQEYPPNNNGLPFGPHPHRGMETVTFIIEGDIAHNDSGGHTSVIHKNGVQYMTAGKGLIHSEVSSETFKEKGGPLEILQLWLNLPARLKMSQPQYIGKEAEEIPWVEDTENGLAVQVLFGRWKEQAGAFESQYPLFLSSLHMKEGAHFSKSVPKGENVFCYIVRGKVDIDGKKVPFRNLIEFVDGEEEIAFAASEDSIVLLGHASPFGEPIVAQGPFVMNSQQEIIQAYRDFQEGKFE